MKIPTDPDEILNMLSDLSASLRDGLDAGGLEARHHFKRLSREFRKPVEINRPLATGIVRYRTLMHIKANRKVGCPYHVKDVANNGIAIRYDWCHVKVYKSLDGEPPTAHNTAKNRAFYSHNQSSVGQPKLKGVTWRKNWQHLDWEKVAWI
jgi:hypothetical protein